MTGDERLLLVPRIHPGCRICYFACPYNTILEGKRLVRSIERVAERRGVGMVTSIFYSGGMAEICSNL